MNEDTEKAIKMLKDGGIVIFPTDTAFGIGCRMDDEKAVKRLFEIRKRPETQATPVLVDSLEMAQRYLLEVPKDVEKKLIKKYWPGALTVILYCNKVKVPKLVRGGGDTLGVRMPNHDTTLKIIKGVGVPILGPSANFHGEKTPYELEDLDKELIKLVDYVVPGECTLKQPSTVIDCSKKPWKVLREGAIKILKQVQDDNIIVLIIDSSDNKRISVGLEIDGKEYIETKKIDSNKPQIILPLIDKALNKRKLTLKDLSAIKVNARIGGSFTGIRVGMSIANALSFVLNIPVEKITI